LLALLPASDDDVALLGCMQSVVVRTLAPGMRMFSIRSSFHFAPPPDASLTRLPPATIKRMLHTESPKRA